MPDFTHPEQWAQTITVISLLVLIITTGLQKPPKWYFASYVDSLSDLWKQRYDDLATQLAVMRAERDEFKAMAFAALKTTEDAVATAKLAAASPPPPAAPRGGK